MKRVGHLLEAIADWDNLRLAAVKALRGKRSKADARAYLLDLDDNLRMLQRQIQANQVSVGRFHQFTIHDPKERLITAPCFEERVLHHAIMNVCEPHLERWLIADSFACRKGKGRIACLLRAQEFARRFPFYLKLDIRKYFDSIDHSVLNSLLARRFEDGRFLLLAGRIIDSYSVAPGKGVPIGSLTSQHFANFYLSWLDRFLKEIVRVAGYVRYMDDIAIWADSTQQLQRACAALENFLSSFLKLVVKPVPYINRTSHGLDFLGCRLFPDHQRLNVRSRRRFQRKLSELERSLQDGLLTEQEVQRNSDALLAFTRTPGLRSWQFRTRVLKTLAGEGPGLASCPARRQLDQQRQELPLREP